MPVHFKGKSEYDRNYKWLDSFKSKSFTPTIEQIAPPAGCESIELEYKQNYLPVQSRKSASFHPLPEQAADPAGRESTKTGTVMEPPLQRKKRCTGPPTTLSSDFNQFPDAASDDFALLGRNDKFMENVRYKAKSHHTAPAREASPPKQQRLQEKENRRKAPKPTPAPFVDTSKFRQQSRSEEQQPSTPLTPRKEKNESSSLYKEVALREKEAALNQKFSKLDREGGRKTAPSALRQSKEQYSKTIDDNRMESAVKSWVKDKNVGSMNEFAQTNLDIGIADSAPEAPADYALRYKTGVSVPRPRRHKFSEYQKSFSWKDGAKASPVLAAEQVVYNSNPALVPPQKSFVKDSEYAAQFKQYNAMPVSSDDLKAIPRAEKPRSKVKRSKSTGALRVDKRPAAGSGPLITPDNKRQTIESELQGEPQEAPSSPPIHQGKLKGLRSEYSSNFRSPTKFQYDGAWHGADPPHLQPTRESEKEKPVAKKSGPVEDSAPALSNWFAEVIELRRKAAEYKKRAQGTHFSREHLVQLIAQQNQAWDNLSTARSGSSTLSALSLESGASAKLRAQESVEKQKETNLDLDKPVLTNIKQIETECPIKDVSYDYNKIKTMSEGKDGCLMQLPQNLEVKDYRLQTKNLYPDKMENKLFEKQSRKIELLEKPLLKFENIDTNNETLDNELCKGVRKSNDKMQQLKADPIVMETKFNNKLRLETKKESTNHRNVKTKSKKVEMANKIEDDVSLMAHEGSDEEQGKPDFVPEKHMDLTTKQRYKKSQSRKKAWQEMDESRDYGQDDLSLMVQEGSERRAKSGGRKKHRSRRARRREQEEASEVTPDFPSDTGRIPTPKMRSKSAGARHHLDRTTPVVGGAMLSSPPRPEKKSPVKVSRSWCTPQDVYDDEVSTVLSSDRFEPVVGQKLAKTYDVKKGPIATTPTFGLASKDTHFLRDDEVSVDKPLETVFVDSPAKVRMTGNVSSGDEKPARKSKKPTKFEAQRTIKEGYGQTYNKPMVWGIDGGMTIPRIEPDDDALSLSVRSIASSCSLASEVYERAQKRTQEFWGKNGIASR